MKKLICVAFIGGRCGSSLVMGLLNRCGMNTGPHGNVKSIENPDGFYEVPALQAWCYNKEAFQHVKPFGEPFSVDQIKMLARQKPLLENIFKTEFKDHWPIAIKTMDFAGVACFETDIDYEVYVVCLHRNIEEQCDSIAKMWSKPEFPAYRFRPWVERMYEWMEQYKRDIHVPYLDCDYEDFFKKPQKSAKRICEFCKIPYKKTALIGWVNPLFSRSRYGRNKRLHSQ